MTHSITNTVTSPVSRNAPIPVDLVDDDKPCSLTDAGDDQPLLRQVIAHYCNALKYAPRVRAMLRRLKLDDEALIAECQLGFCDRTLGPSLPEPDTPAGDAVRGQLQRLRVLRGSGHERFRGALVVPVCDEAGTVVDLYGHGLWGRVPEGATVHLSLHVPPQGVFNLAALADHDDIILCSSVLDALTVRCAGLHNVTCTLGIKGLTEAHVSAFEFYRVQRVSIAFERTPAANRAARLIAQVLNSIDIECRRVVLPAGFTVNRYVRQNAQADAAFNALLRRARPCRQTYHTLLRDRTCVNTTHV